MRTAVYIDGYNLYYGLLKNSAYKWLNMHGLFGYLINEQNPSSELVECNFYTALTKSKLASRGEKSVQSQQVYHRALESVHTPPVRVVCYSYALEPKPMVAFREGTPPAKTDRHMVWHTSEKKCDVCLAMSAYRSAASGQVDQIVIVSNDTDFEPLLEAIRDDFPRVVRGVISPRRPNGGRPASAGLGARAHWMRHHVSEDELARYQFPDRVPTRKRPATKPDYW